MKKSTIFLTGILIIGICFGAYALTNDSEEIIFEEPKYSINPYGIQEIIFEEPKDSINPSRLQFVQPNYTTFTFTENTTWEEFKEVAIKMNLTFKYDEEPKTEVKE